MKIDWSLVCAMALFGLLAAFAFVRADEPRASLRVSPPANRAGGSAWVICRVPKRAENRRVNFGIPGLRMSETKFENGGEKADSQYKMMVEEIPCLYPTEARCEVDYVVATADGSTRKTYVSRQPILLAGCDDSSDSLFP